MARELHSEGVNQKLIVMKRFFLLVTTLIMATAMIAGCSKREERWREEEREALRQELEAYREMIYLNNLANEEFDAFSYDVVDAVEFDYPVYTTFVEMPGAGDTLQVYVVSTIVEELDTDPHNMRNIYPYPMLVAEGVLPAGLNGRGQRAFYECFAGKVDNNFASTADFFNAILADTLPTSVISTMQRDCASSLFGWSVDVSEVVTE